MGKGPIKGTGDEPISGGINFVGEAYESCAAFYNLLTPHRRLDGEIGTHGLIQPVSDGIQGYAVTVTLRNGDTFDAEVRDVLIAEDGFYKLVVWPWHENKDESNPEDEMQLDIYDEIQFVTVL